MCFEGMTIRVPRHYFCSFIDELYYQMIAMVLQCCIARFISDLVRNPEDRFSHNKAHILSTMIDFFRLSAVYYCNM